MKVPDLVSAHLSLKKQSHFTHQFFPRESRELFSNSLKITFSAFPGPNIKHSIIPGYYSPFPDPGGGWVGVMTLFEMEFGKARTSFGAAMDKM